MPKDPKRNLQRYQVRAGHLNEFEFQKSQRELAEDSKFPFGDQTGQPGLNQAEREATITEDADRKVEKRKETAQSKTGGDLSIAPGKKVARKSARKTLTKSPTKNRGKVALEAKKSPKKPAKSSKKTTKQASTKPKAGTQKSKQPAAKVKRR